MGWFGSQFVLSSYFFLCLYSLEFLTYEVCGKESFDGVLHLFLHIFSSSLIDCILSPWVTSFLNFRALLSTYHPDFSSFRFGLVVPLT